MLLKNEEYGFVDNHLRNFVLKFEASEMHRGHSKKSKNNLERAITQLFEKKKKLKKDIIFTRLRKT